MWLSRCFEAPGSTTPTLCSGRECQRGFRGAISEALPGHPVKGESSLGDCYNRLGHSQSDPNEGSADGEDVMSESW